MIDYYLTDMNNDKKGKLKSTELGYRETNNYFDLRCDLKGAVSYDDDYNRNISYEVLQ